MTGDPGRNGHPRPPDYATEDVAAKIVCSKECAPLGGLRRSRRVPECRGPRSAATARRAQRGASPGRRRCRPSASGRRRKVCATLTNVDRLLPRRVECQTDLGWSGAPWLRWPLISGDPDPWVEDAVHDVDHQVHDDIDDCHEQRDSKQDRDNRASAPPGH